MSTVSSLLSPTMISQKDSWTTPYFEFMSDLEDFPIGNAERRAAIYQELMDNMLLYHEAIKREEQDHIEKGIYFNVFELWNKFTGLGETAHSRLIHFLLQPNPLHGQKEHYLNELLTMLGITPISGGAPWTVTAESGRVDVMIRRINPESVIMLENKSNWAPDQENQLYRYWYQNIHKRPEDCFADYYDGKDYRIVYLAPKKEKHLSENSLQRPDPSWFPSQEICDSLPQRLPLEPLIWSFDEELALWLQRCINVTPPGNHALIEFLRQYKNYCKSL